MEVDLMDCIPTRWPDPLSRSRSAETDQRALAGIRVLVVDDSAINLDLIKRILEFTGAEVTLAENGLEACNRLRARPMDYDLVLMDVQMPLLDGHAATREIRDVLGLVDLPVIALTAGASSSESQRVVVSSMNDFIIKPFDANILVITILRNLPRDRRGAVAGPVTTALPREIEEGWPDIEGIDATEARSRLLGDFSLFLSCLRRLLTESADLEATVANPPMEMDRAFGQRMHKLKGMAGMIGAHVIEHLASRAEAASKSNDCQEVSSIGRQLSVGLQQLRQGATKVLASVPFSAYDSMSTMDGELRAKLIDMLVEHDLAAVDLFNSLAPSLRRHLGRRSFEAVRDLMDQLRLSEAAEALGRADPDFHRCRTSLSVAGGM